MNQIIQTRKYLLCLTCFSLDVVSHISLSSFSIDGCADGNGGSFHSDESLDKIVVKAVNYNGFYLEYGGTARVVATAYVYSTSSNNAEFFYAADATNPSWVYIGSVKPVATGLQDLTLDYQLPSGSQTQAVRVQFRYDGGSSTTNPCVVGNYNDRDDVVFKVYP